MVSLHGVDAPLRTVLTHSCCVLAGGLGALALLSARDWWRQRALSGAEDPWPLLPTVASAAFWLDGYRRRVRTEEFPVRAAVAPGSVAAALPDSAPVAGEPWAAILQDLEDVILPGVTHWESPRFMAYFKPHSSVASVVGELVSAGINAMGFSWVACPASTELEMVVMDWLARMLGLPATMLNSSGVGGGVIQSSAGEATIVAVVAAREKYLRQFPEAERQDVAQKLVLYSSDQTHSVLENACMILGVPLERYKKIPTRRTTLFAMDAGDLKRQMQADRAEGLFPFFVCATLGTTSTGAYDSLDGIGPVCEVFDAWLHVDGAWGGVVPICPELRSATRGVEFVHSYNTNAHKQLLTNFDCSPMWVRDRQWLLQALSLTPEYLRNRASDAGAVIDYKDWQLPLGRRFRSLKLWMVLRAFGVSGIQRHIRLCCEHASSLGRLLEGHKHFKLFVPPSFSLVCFQVVDDSGTTNDALNRRFLDTLTDKGRVFAIHSVVDGEFFIRLACGGVEQQHSDVLQAFAALEDALHDVL